MLLQKIDYFRWSSGLECVQSEDMDWALLSPVDDVGNVLLMQVSNLEK